MININFPAFKRFFLISLIGSLIVSALVAVYTVLVGEFNELASRTLFTLFMVVLHSLVSLGFIWDDERQKTFERLNFFINVLFLLIVVSFITSILGVWEIIGGSLLYKLYQTYFILGFASLHGDLLSKTLNVKNHIDMIVYANYTFITIVALMLQPAIYIDNSYKVLGDLYFRILGAAAIIDGTLSVLAIIFYKMYLKDNPDFKTPFSYEVKKENGILVKGRLNNWIWLVAIYLAFQIISGIFSYRY